MSEDRNQLQERRKQVFKEVLSVFKSFIMLFIARESICDLSSGKIQFTKE